MSPGRLPSARFSTLRPSEESRDPFYVRAKRPRTLVARLDRLALVPDAPPNRAIPHRLGLPFGSPWRDGKDASYRPLQSTHDTSTRKPLDYRAHDLRRADPAGPPACRDPKPKPEYRPAFVLRGAGPSCDNPTPVGLALDGAGPAWARRDTVSPRPLSRSAASGRPCLERPPHRSVFFSDDAARPTSDVPCRLRRSRFPEIGEDQDRFHRPLVNTNDLVRPETPSIDRCSLASAFAPAISD
jgi:hypothetical protein